MGFICFPPSYKQIDADIYPSMNRYRIVVSDLKKHISIWFGGKDRSEESMDKFYQYIEEKASKNIGLAVMDMWKPFEKSAKKNIPQVAILYDKFHVIKHLGDAF
ncbi:transposase [Patescibacteria group bacterium]|nr:transposase [Patescibacteria group bacterium]